jgi:four helix bundle protein
MTSQEPPPRKTYDLEERTAKFGEAVVRFAKSLPAGPVTFPIISQLVRSGTSVGANYCEADESGSKKEFRHKISLCKKESRETKHWLRMIAAAVPEVRTQAVPLWKEAKELTLIFGTVFRNTRC